MFTLVAWYTNMYNTKNWDKFTCTLLSILMLLRLWWTVTTRWVLPDHFFFFQALCGNSAVDTGSATRVTCPGNLAAMQPPLLTTALIICQDNREVKAFIGSTFRRSIPKCKHQEIAREYPKPDLPAKKVSISTQTSWEHALPREDELGCWGVGCCYSYPSSYSNKAPGAHRWWTKTSTTVQSRCTQYPTQQYCMLGCSWDFVLHNPLQTLLPE